MPSFEKPAQWSSKWFTPGILVLWLIALALRFWGLERFNTLVFDEVYYVKFAHNYLTQTPFFDGHPPLSKYLLAFGIWLGNQLPIAQDTVNGLAGAPYTTWSYRWLNAFTGSLIPLVIIGIAYQISHRHRYALIAGLFATVDGLFLVESRYALNNIYLIILGLLGLWCLLLALDHRRWLGQGLWLSLAGIFFGAAVAIKWNGLWFLLGAYGLWATAWFLHWIQSANPEVPVLFPIASTTPDNSPSWRSPLQHLPQVQWWQMLLYLGIVPFGFYRLSWIPHLQTNPNDNFWKLQQQILTYHQSVGSGPNVHPYCSDWYSWLMMVRPVAYFYQVTQPGDPLPNGTAQFTPTTNSVIYDVHAMGNPVLWWLSTAAIALVLLLLIQSMVSWVICRNTNPQRDNSITPHLTTAVLNPNDRWLALFLVVNYGANLLPWVRVTRCIFLYHYMGASVFATLALAWVCDRCLHSQQQRLRTYAIAIMLLVVLAFIFWLPIYLGLPLSLIEFQARMWFPSWL